MDFLLLIIPQGWGVIGKGPWRGILPPTVPPWGSRRPAAPANPPTFPPTTGEEQMTATSIINNAVWITAADLRRRPVCRTHGHRATTPPPPPPATTTTPSPRSSTCGKSGRAPRGRERAPDERGWRDQRVRVSTSICPLLPQLDQRANCPLIDGDSFAINLPSKTPSPPPPPPHPTPGRRPRTGSN